VWPVWRSRVSCARTWTDQLRDLIVTAPESLRGELSSLSTSERVAHAARFPTADQEEPVRGIKRRRVLLWRSADVPR
jgi:hypothetical protein